MHEYDGGFLLTLIGGLAGYDESLYREWLLNHPDERARAESWLRTTFALPEDADLAGLGDLAADPAMLRGAELWRLGMLAEARDEFEGMRTRFENDPASLYRLMNYFQDLGVYRSAAFAAAAARIPLAMQAAEETGMGVIEDKVIKNHFASEYVYNKYKHCVGCGRILLHRRRCV